MKRLCFSVLSMLCGLAILATATGVIADIHPDNVFQLVLYVIGAISLVTSINYAIEAGATGKIASEVDFPLDSDVLWEVLASEVREKTVYAILQSPSGKVIARKFQGDAKLPPFFTRKEKEFVGFKKPEPA